MAMNISAPISCICVSFLIRPSGASPADIAPGAAHTGHILSAAQNTGTPARSAHISPLEPGTPADKAGRAAHGRTAADMGTDRADTSLASPP